MDQSLSADNFRRIWDLRTRRGEDLLDFFPVVASLTREIREHRVAAGSVTTKVTTSHEDVAEAEVLRELRRKRRTELKNQLLDLSVKVSSQIDDGAFTFGLKAGPSIGGRQTFQIDVADPAVYFTSRQIEWNIRRAFDVRPANRNLIVEQIVRTLQDKTPKAIARTDLRQFYESVDHASLLEFLTESGLLSATTRRLVSQLLNEYSALMGVDHGLPRGLAVSATLAEAYLTPLDRDLRRLEGVLLYARYVDDILVIFVDDAFNPDLPSRKRLLREAVKRRKLSMNPGKTKYLRTPHATGGVQKLTFLGYQLTLRPTGVDIDISSKRASRYRAKLDASFDSFLLNRSDPRALPALGQRVKFLTGNTRLANNKRQALVGSHFSNPLIPVSTKAFSRLDSHLKSRIDTLPISQAAKTALVVFTFADGIETRRFHRFSPRQLQQIVTVWKNV